MNWKIYFVILLSFRVLCYWVSVDDVRLCPTYDPSLDVVCIQLIYRHGSI